MKKNFVDDKTIHYAYRDVIEFSLNDKELIELANKILERVGNVPEELKKNEEYVEN